MPNTLIHIALQAPTSRLAFPKSAMAWILLGIIIPDLPWIFARISLALNLFDPYVSKLYFSVQASLFFSLILCFVFALFSTQPKKVFPLLTANATIHLFLDSLQIKWGNGVHLLAPLSWQKTSLGLLWPENILCYIASFAGVLYLTIIYKKIRKETFAINSPPPLKWICVGLCFYLFLPLSFTQKLDKMDFSYISTLKHTDERPGKEIELDRAKFFHQDSKLMLFTGEKVTLSGNLPASSGCISVKGKFTGSNSIHVAQFQNHSGYRDYASKVGLLLIAAVWCNTALLTYFKRKV